MTTGTASKIVALYADNPNIDRRSGEDAKTQTHALLASGGLHSAYCYTGSRPGYLMFDGIFVTRPNIKKHVYFAVYVDGRDHYNIDVVLVKKDAAEVITHQDGIFFDELAVSYETIYDRYVHEQQDGFIRI